MNRRICLRRPRGSSWSADLVREEGGGVFFQNGWEEFVSDLDLKTGDFLVFKYGGGPRFTVLVFDPTGCEKEASQTAPFPEVVILGESHRTRRRPGKEVVTFVAKEEPQSDEGPLPLALRPRRFLPDLRLTWDLDGMQMRTMHAPETREEGRSQSDRQMRRVEARRGDPAVSVRPVRAARAWTMTSFINAEVRGGQSYPLWGSCSS